MIFYTLKLFALNNLRATSMLKAISQWFPRLHCLRFSIEKVTSHYTTFTPQAKYFDNDAFPKWRKAVSDQYLVLNPLTKEGQQKFATLNTLDFDEVFLAGDPHEAYWDLLIAMHKQGPLDGWYAGTTKGLHCNTGRFIRLFLLYLVLLHSTLTLSLSTSSSSIKLKSLSQIEVTTNSELQFTKNPFTMEKLQRVYSSLMLHLCTSQRQTSIPLKLFGIAEVSIIT